MDRQRLEKIIEQTRAELAEQLREAGYDFSNERVMKISRKLDLLLNLLQRRSDQV
ncbi:MAG TPA: Spo0E family sporulation regulatory protein-aspartic acid phosphatase [Bacillota bacterium]|mgnify:CR=1 FL=1|nr:Spo0E family sporulation regulatory protein-aspartic acid phosphatase [Bacillota bacterium]